MTVRVDHAGNLRGCYPGRLQTAPRLLIGSHLDTVPHAGPFDGILGVLLGLALVELLEGRRLSFHIEVIGFSEEEGVRFDVPFIGSLAVAGYADDELLARSDHAGVSVGSALRNFGLDPSRIGEARIGDDTLGYFEFHIEQGPVLESLDLPLGIVEKIAGQSRLDLLFEGKANHAGTTPMSVRRDALAGAAEWIGAVEREALATPDLVATVGNLEVLPGAGNVIPGSARASLDVRHGSDAARREAVSRLLVCAERIAAQRGLVVSPEHRLDQPAVAMDPFLVRELDQAAADTGYHPHRMVSGAGHDAMILARRMPAAMLFLRSPGGISHPPDETVLAGDVTAALETGMRFLEALDTRHA